MKKSRRVSEQGFIDEIEDYVAGNIEGQETIDRMGFSRFLRNIFREVQKKPKRKK